MSNSTDLFLNLLFEFLCIKLFKLSPIPKHRVKTNKSLIINYNILNLFKQMWNRIFYEWAKLMVRNFACSKTVCDRPVFFGVHTLLLSADLQGFACRKIPYLCHLLFFVQFYISNDVLFIFQVLLP